MTLAPETRDAIEQARDRYPQPRSAILPALWAVQHQIGDNLGLSATYLTGGTGYLSPSWGIDLAYRGKVQGGIENTLFTGLRVFVN